MSQEIENVSQAPDVWQGGTWNDLVAGSHEVFGADLEKGQFLIGVPLVLIMATFRPGDFANKNGEKGYYVSLDAIIAPSEMIEKGLRRGRIPESNAEYVRESAGDHIVFNEGGTGVYRQIVQFLENTSRIKINSELGQEGGYGESRYDLSPETWEVDDSAEFRISPDGKPTLAFSIRLSCPRGLRESEYENEYTKTGLTRYIG